MDDDLIDDDGLSLSRKSRLPGAGFFYPDSLDEEYADRRARDAVSGAEAVVVADGDADGLACAALVREARDAALDVAPFEASLATQVVPGAEDGTGGGDAAGGTDAEDGTDADGGSDDDTDESPVGLVTASPRSLVEALERVAAYADPAVDVYVCDLCPDDETALAAVEAVVDRADSVRWFDHHQWDDALADAVRAAGVDLVVGESDEECTADVALRSLSYPFPDHLDELAAVTRDHDLWVKEDPRSDDLADYAHWAGAEEYVTVVGRYGPDLPDPVRDYLTDRRVEKERLIDAAVERADLRTVGPWTVGVTYGRCSQNEVAERLRERGADAAVVVKPAGSASIRGSEGFERCHEVAAQVNGGGHPRAAGCKPDIYHDMLDYARHWTTEGYATRQVILAAFERLAADGGDADDGADGNGGSDGRADDE